MSIKPTEMPAPPATKPILIQNTTEASTGQPLVQRVQARRAELIKLREGTPEANLTAHADLDRAIAGADSMLTGDLTHVADVLAAEMSRWLEGNKHLAEKTPKA